ncbi:uncharacterized protein LOC143552188 [Bidens hawaiensis]|uniref:uncharacterized protein LOC143552188 n=1 Tax=Bidens hawaiensis TaxID=980011 RepID=UPI004049264B
MLNDPDFDPFFGGIDGGGGDNVDKRNVNDVRVNVDEVNVNDVGVNVDEVNLNDVGVNVDEVNVNDVGVNADEGNANDVGVNVYESEKEDGENSEDGGDDCEDSGDDSEDVDYSSEDSGDDSEDSGDDSEDSGDDSYENESDMVDIDVDMRDFRLHTEVDVDNQEVMNALDEMVMEDEPLDAELFNTCANQKDSLFYKGELFGTKEEVKKMIRAHAVESRREIRIVKDDVGSRFG